jgi:hypothetical protein
MISLYQSKLLPFMKIWKRIVPLVDVGLMNTVVRQLLSRKEATVFAGNCGTKTRYGVQAG